MSKLFLVPATPQPLPVNAPPESSPAESMDPATDSNNVPPATDSDNLPPVADSDNDNLPRAAVDSDNLPPAAAADGSSITGELTAELWLSETDDRAHDGSELGLPPPAPSTAHKLPSNTNTSDAENVCDAGDNVENVSDAVKGDITSTYSSQSDMVSFVQLHLFPVATLTAAVYYNPDDEEQRPLTLATMGYGVPGFPDIENDETLEKATTRSKSQMYNKSDVYPNMNRGKSHLMKEVMRRALMKSSSKKVTMPRPKRWSVNTCIEHLKTNPPVSIEHDLIVERWSFLIQTMKDYSLEQSSTSQAKLWRHVRLTECMLHSSLRSEFRTRNRQKTQYELDAKNSKKLPLT